MRRKKQSRNGSPTPRYLTIKIQYWPIPRLVLFSPLLVILCYVLFSFVYSSLRAIENRVAIPTTIRYSPEIASSLQFAKLLAMTPPKSLSKEPVIIFHGSRNRREVALTFDADMTYGMQEMLSSDEVQSFYDQDLIAYLTKDQVKATLFLTGLWIETYSDTAKELAKNPLFELANHSYSHKSFSGDCYGLGEMSDEEDKEEITKTQTLLKDVSGKDTKLFRFPGGCYSQTDLVSAKKAGVIPVQWDVVAHDGFNDDGEAIFHNVVDHVSNGSIIVMHMNGVPNEPQTAKVVPRIVEKLRAKGYTFVTVSELLKAKQTPEIIIYHSLVSP